MKKPEKLDRLEELSQETIDNFNKHLGLFNKDTDKIPPSDMLMTSITFFSMQIAALRLKIEEIEKRLISAN